MRDRKYTQVWRLGSINYSEFKKGKASTKQTKSRKYTLNLN